MMNQKTLQGLVLVLVSMMGMATVEAGASNALPWRPEIPFDKVEPGIHSQRLLPFEIPEDGLYELAAQMSSIPRIFQLWLDGEPLFYVQGERAGVSVADQRLDPHGRAKAVRYLTRGKHVATVYGHYGPWIWEDEMGLILKSMRIGASRVKDGDTASALAIRLVDKHGKGRSDLVFRKGESLILELKQNTGAGKQISMLVKEQRGDGRVVWTGAVTLAARKTPASAELCYPCDREGAFEYSIKDGEDKTVDGPWAFVVVDATPASVARTGASPAELKGEIVDYVDCTLPADVAHKLRDNGTSQVVDSPVGRYRVTGTSLMQPISYVKDGKSWRRAKDGEKGEGPAQSAADWFAYTLKVKNPGKPHILVAYVPNDVRRLVSVQAFDQVTGNYNGWCLDAGEAPAAGPFGKLTFLIWPNGSAIDVLTWCSNGNHGSQLNRQGAVAKFELMELADDLPAAPVPVGGLVSKREVGWEGEQVNLGIVERTTPSLWEGSDLIPGSLPYGVYPGAAYSDWRTLLTAWDRFGQLAGFRGDNLCVAPVYTYGMTCLQEVPHLPKCWDVYSSGYRGRVVDPIERDIFKMMLLVAEKHSLRMVADLMVHRLEDVLPTFAQSMGCTNMDGVFVTDGAGRILRTISNNQMLNPAHPVARAYYLKVIDEIASRYGSAPAFAGIKIRQWTGWPSAMDAWYLNEQNGYDDFTVALFEKETGSKVPVDAKGDVRIQLRQKILLGELRKVWFDWRCKKVQSLLEEAVVVMRRHAPNAKLYSGVTLGADVGVGSNRGGGLDAEKLVGKSDIGFEPHRKFAGEGVEWNFPDPIDFANFDIRVPPSVRRTLENFHPRNGFNYPIGMCCAESFRPHPYQLEEPAKALAGNKLEMFTYGPAWCLPPIDEGYRRFVQVFRAIPVLPYVQFGGQGSEQPVIVCWSAVRTKSGSFFGGRETVCYLVNTTDKRREATLTFANGVTRAENLVDGRRLAIARNCIQVTLEPFMPAVFAVDGTASIRQLDIAVDPVELDAVMRQVEAMKTIRERAGVVRHVFTQTTGVDGGWARREATETFDDAWIQIENAWRDGKPLLASHLIDRMLVERSWWFEVFGWPAERYVPMTPSGQTAGSRDFQASGAWPKRLKPGAAEYVQISPYKEKFLVAPQGVPVVVSFNPGSGRCEFRAWGLFGGDYGPVRVEYAGKLAGKLGVAGGVERQVHQALATSLAWPWSPQEITLIGEGPKGLAISLLEVRLVPPVPIKRWSVLGVFDKGTPTTVPREGGADGMAKVFPPEKQMDLMAVYNGLDGKEIRWQQIDIGDAPFIRLLETFPGTGGDGVAYLACWVQSPVARDADLYYAMDWFGKVWLNDQVVLGQVSGPWNHFARQPVRLKAGWNKLLVKTARGSEGWMANFAISDPGDLQYSATPPDNATPVIK